eukprot:190662-Pleurochrysis_carterae.AAC.1
MKSHAPPTQRRQTRGSSGGAKRTRPHARHTRSDGIACSTEFGGQATGNATLGGAHEGRSASKGAESPFRTDRLVAFPAAARRPESGARGGRRVAGPAESAAS